MEKQNAAHELPSTLSGTSFRDLVCRHLDRLAGAGWERHAMPPDVAGIASVVLLVEREASLRNTCAESPERYTDEDLLQELLELLPDEQDELAAAVRWLEENHFVDIGSEGRLRPTEASSATSRLLDQVFPTMPGMGLVAILVQTIEEVQTGRKAMDLALDQLDHSLHSHGVPLSQAAAGTETGRNETGEPDPAVPRGAAKRTGDQVRERLRAYALQEQARKANPPVQAESPFQQSDRAPAERTDPFSSRDLSADADISGEIGAEPGPAEPETSAADEPAEAAAEAAGGSEETDGAALEEQAVAEEEERAVDTERPVEPSKPVEETPGPVAPQIVGSPEDGGDPAGEEEPEPQPGRADEDKQGPGGDDPVESRILQFEQNLAMPCPVCRTGRIHENRTSKGKVFYQCSSETCMFIHWGRPYSIPCPLCGNPFLVEVAERDGKTVLKCPRAACRHRQPLPGESSAPPAPPSPGTALSNDNGARARVQKKGRRKVRKVLVRKKKAG